jgi:hypothetical protein
MVKQYPKETLISYKKDHEERVNYLTSFGPESETVIVRMIGNIRGNGIAISNEQVRESVLSSSAKYPRYLSGENTIEIDLGNIPETADDLYWSTGKGKIDDIVNRLINPAIENKRIMHLSVFALARIPFLIHLGYALGDKIPVDLYQKHKNNKEDWIWPKEGDKVAFKTENLQSGNDKSKVALMISLSGKISLTQLPLNITNDYSVYEISPIGIEPHRSIISLKESIDEFRSSYQKLLREIEKIHTHSEGIHLFSAAPAPVAIICGREVLKGVSPSILVYDKVESGYKLITKIN